MKLLLVFGVVLLIPNKLLLDDGLLFLDCEFVSGTVVKLKFGFDELVALTLTLALLFVFVFPNGLFILLDSFGLVLLGVAR